MPHSDAQSTQIVAQLPDAELDHLETLLEDHTALPDAFRLDQIQGYLCAALSGPSNPHTLTDEDWLFHALGGEQAQDSENGREAMALLRRFAANLNAELAAGTPPVLLLYPEDGDESAASDYQPWCQAYLEGVDAAEDDWFEFLGEQDGDDEANEEIDYLDERLFPFMLLTGEAEAAARQHDEDWPTGEALVKITEECKDSLSQNVLEIYRFWRAKRGTPSLRRSSPKVGRNEPCPCGSGKKHKQCCAAGEGKSS